MLGYMYINFVYKLMILEVCIEYISVLSYFKQNILYFLDATIYVGGLDDKVTESLMWELFVQSGPVGMYYSPLLYPLLLHKSNQISFQIFPVNVHMPKDRVTQMHQGYGFVEFMGEEDADYAIKIMNMIKLYGKPIRVNKASAHQKNLDVGANIFIGNLDPEVDEKLLYDTFSAFGVILQTPKVIHADKKQRD